MLLNISSYNNATGNVTGIKVNTQSKQYKAMEEKGWIFTPAFITVEEHHTGVYASKKDNGLMVKSKEFKKLLPGSPVSPSLGAALMNAKFVNALPLARIEKEMERNGLAITRQNMANWMIRLGEEYIAVMYAAQSETTQTDAEMLLKLLQKPELAALLKTLAKSL